MDSEVEKVDSNQLPKNYNVSKLASELATVSLVNESGDIDANLTSEELEKQLEIEKLFRSHLSQQLIEEYRRYAIEQHPKDISKQHELITQMQEDHFLHYMQDVQQSLIQNQRAQLCYIEHLNNTTQTLDQDKENPSNEPNKLKIYPLIPARMWVRPDIVTFKKEILTTAPNCCIKISSLSIATVSVPTHIDGASVWWEFATDHYDLGFGLYFEWSVDPSDQILVTINDSDDEIDEDAENLDEDEESEEDGEGISQATFETSSNSEAPNSDPESGRKNRHRRKSSNGLPTDELIPIIRRDCHQQVYCGQHMYPGQGRYLFKFDNSFSLIRAKWLYYRAYYSKA